MNIKILDTEYEILDNKYETSNILKLTFIK